MKKKHTVENIVQRPIKAIQFGDGAFARSVFGRILTSANEDGANANCIIITDKQLEKKQQVFASSSLVLSGLRSQDTVKIDCVSSVLDPYTNFDAFSALADSKDIDTVFWAPEDASWLLSDGKLKNEKQNPLGMLLMLLFRRHCLEMRGFTIVSALPYDFNGDKLKQDIIELASLRQLGMDFVNWLNFENMFVNSFADCRVGNAVLTDSGLNIPSEKYLLFVVDKENSLLASSSLVAQVDSIKEYYALNTFVKQGALTASCAYALLHDVKTLDSFISKERLAKHMTVSVFEEIIPALDVNFETMQVFALDMFKRFENSAVPFYWEKYSENLGEKFALSIAPILRHYYNNDRPAPKHLVFGLFCTIQFYKNFEPNDKFAKLFAQSTDVLADKALWNCDLSFLKKEMESFEKRFNRGE